MYDGSFVLNLYCDKFCVKQGEVYDKYGHFHDEFPHQYVGWTWGLCKKQAQNDGWVFHRDGKVSCPKCNGYDKINKESIEKAKRSLKRKNNAK